MRSTEGICTQFTFYKQQAEFRQAQYSKQMKGKEIGFFHHSRTSFGKKNVHNFPFIYLKILRSFET